ncbi:MAG: periplasmic heavy metal sensor [Nitrospirae bacterium]|nr:periplasmic heavy metal sensor [Nitrospirota bacterium]
MTQHHRSTALMAATTLAATLFLLTGTDVLAQTATHPGPHPPRPMMGGMDPGMMGAGGMMGMMGTGGMAGMHGDMSGGKGHDMGPHNAASHFLQMADKLNLDDAQIAQLKTLRDAYITAHATDTERLKAARADLATALHADVIDTDAVNRILKEVDTLEDKLWPAFVNQLRDIKALLTADQRQRLGAMR